MPETETEKQTLIVVQTCRCKICGELILPQFMKECPHGCKKSNPQFYKYHRYQDFKVPFTSITGLLAGRK